MKNLCFTALVAAICFLQACSEKEPFVEETFVMGTFAQVTIYGMSGEDAEEAAGEALKEFHRIESVMSTWKGESEISRLNRGSMGEPFTVSPELFAVIDSSIYYSGITSGAFDITARPLVKLWGFQGGEARLPGEREIMHAKRLVGYGKIEIDHSSSTVVLPPGMELDLAGIAKGYAVDRCASILKRRGVGSGLVNLGGNIYAIGAPPGKEGWSVGIRNPVDTREIMGSFILRDEAVATSGNYENYVEIEGKRYGHIIDPRTGRPVSDILSVTVIAPNAIAADALSTGLFVLGTDGSKGILDGLPAVKAYFITPGDSDRVFSTVAMGGFEDRIISLEMEMMAK